MEKQEEYELRNKIYDINKSCISKELDRIYAENKKYISEIIYYSLVTIEDGFYGPDISKHIYGAFQRNAYEWFLKEILQRGAKYTPKKFKEDKYKNFKQSMSCVINIYMNYMFNEQLYLKRSINKILIKEIEENIYELYVPTIKDKHSLQDIYYRGEADKELNKKEGEIKNKTTMYLLENYNFYNDIINCNIEELKRKEKLIDNLDKHIDRVLYELCIECVSVDIDKVGNEFKSELIDSKSQLKKILGFLYYMCRVKLFQCSFKDSLFDEFRGNFVISYRKTDLIDLVSKHTGEDKKKINEYIDYLTIQPSLIGGINEYPLFVVGEYVLFTPASFMMNDFQFSILNGHYEKGIKVIDRQDTVSQSVVDKIILKCNKYSNLITISNKEYFEKTIKFNNKDFKSDIDVAIYDKISNVLIIIECKWKENVYLKHEDYVKMEDAIDKIYKNQLNKHKAFLELKEENLDFIFNDNSDVMNRPWFPTVSYIFVDKRIQYHKDGKHAFSEFMFLHLLDKYSVNNVARLDLVVREINSLTTEVEYSKKPELFEIHLDDNKIIRNNIFSLFKKQ